MPPAAGADAASESAEAIETSDSDSGSECYSPLEQEKGKVPGQIPELSRDVVSILKKLEPWKVLMPTELRSEMEHVATLAEECKRADDDAQYSSPAKSTPEWDFEIKKKPMSLWPRSCHSRPGPPVPLLETYYWSLGPADSLEASSANFSQALLEGPFDMMAGQKNLQRIKITSRVLHSELELLTSSTITFPIITAPPYKLLLQYLPQMKIRLAELRHELAEATSNPGTDGNGGATLNNAEKTNSTERDRGQRDQEDGLPYTRAPEHLRTRIAHWETLIGFIDTSLGDLVEIKSRIADGTLDKIAFDDLWHLFRPGDLVLSKRRGQRQLFKVHFVSGGQVRKRALTTADERTSFTDIRDFGDNGGAGTWSPLKLDAFIMNFGGIQVGPEDHALIIKYYPGKKLVTDLSVSPVRFHPEKDKVLARMEERGRKFMSSAGHRYYEGLTLGFSWARALGGSAELTRSKRTASHQRYGGIPYGGPMLMTANKTANKSEDIASEIFVDFEAFFKTFQYLEPVIGRLSSSRQDPTETSESVSDLRPCLRHYGDEVDTNLAESFRVHNRAFIQPFEYAEEPEKMMAEHFQLLPHYVPAYCFRYRQWNFLNVDLVQPIDPNRYSGFDDLVIPMHYKELLLALVDNHTSGLQRRKEKLKKSLVGLGGAQIDLVHGKGQGLIILLHGPPGSGKTSTAETIAAHTQRPLYSITCGDIGLEPKEVESQLGEHTARADKWGCVLLLDEADVFLMQRTWKEVDRNALVSVFLRQLEYYSGILFLTTNRPGTIDEAFKSRIHLSLRYPSIDLPSTKQMWDNIMRRLETESARAEIRVEFDRRKLLAFAEQHYKRRQAIGSTWNGRQIRNAFQTALALGHADRQAALGEAGKTPEWAAASGKKRWMTVKLTAKNFRRIARATTEFEDYIVALRGRDSDAAREAEVRDDDYDPDMVPARKNYGAPLMRAGGWNGRETMVASVSEPGGRQGQTRPRRSRKETESEDDEDEDEDEDEEDEEENDEGEDDG
ncbi:hypothetical protein DL771_004557 [Monosporascus sp. 5C6A]|nr:hypothetical protein DL771_004557 [Monosporascus sp. 5C6A]